MVNDLNSEIVDQKNEMQDLLDLNSELLKVHYKVKPKEVQLELKIR